MFAPAMGIARRPGDRLGGCGLCRRACRLRRSATAGTTFVIEQGYEMGRPSLLHLSLSLRGGALESATVGGDAVIVSEGMIEA